MRSKDCVVLVALLHVVACTDVAPVKDMQGQDMAAPVHDMARDLDAQDLKPEQDLASDVSPEMGAEDMQDLEDEDMAPQEDMPTPTPWMLCTSSETTWLLEWLRDPASKRDGFVRLEPNPEELRTPLNVVSVVEDRLTLAQGNKPVTLYWFGLDLREIVNVGDSLYQFNNAGRAVFRAGDVIFGASRFMSWAPPKEEWFLPVVDGLDLEHSLVKRCFFESPNEHGGIVWTYELRFRVGDETLTLGFGESGVLDGVTFYHRATWDNDGNFNGISTDYQERFAFSLPLKRWNGPPP